jgi:hypothetical protein
MNVNVSAQLPIKSNFGMRLSKPNRAQVRGPLVLFQATYKIIPPKSGKFVIISSGSGTIGREHRRGEGVYGQSKVSTMLWTYWVRCLWLVKDEDSSAWIEAGRKVIGMAYKIDAGYPVLVGYEKGVRKPVYEHRKSAVMIDWIGSAPA